MRTIDRWMDLSDVPPFWFASQIRAALCAGSELSRGNVPPFGFPSQTRAALFGGPKSGYQRRAALWVSIPETCRPFEVPGIRSWERAARLCDGTKRAARHCDGFGVS